MKRLHYVKASDMDFIYCFLDVSINKDLPPFMDIRITDDLELQFCIYSNVDQVLLTADDWLEIHSVAKDFYTSEIENANAAKDWER